MRWLLLLLAVFWSAPALAQLRLAPAQAPKTLEIEANAQLAVVEAPFFTDNFPELRAHGFVLDLNGAYALSPEWTLGARAPLSLMNVRQPAGSFLQEAAWGNPGLFARRRFATPWLQDRKLEAWASASGWLPLAEHGPASSLLENRALEAANAAFSYLAPEAFTPAVVPLTLQGGMSTRQGPFGAEMAVAAPLLLRIGDAELPAETRRHRLGFLPSLRLSGSADPWRILRVSLEADAAFALARVFEPRRATSRLQLSLRPGVLFRVGRHLDIGLTFVAPLAGALGGSAYGGALTLRVR